MKFLSCAFLALFLLSQCSSEDRTTDPVSPDLAKDSLNWKQRILGPEEMLSTHIGQDLQEFIANKAPATITEGGEYTFDGKLEDGTPFTFYITADQGRIYEMNLDLLPDSARFSQVFQELLNYMDSLYHPSHPADGYATWRRSGQKGSLIEVTLADISLEMGRPAIMINQLEHVDRRFEE